LAWPIFSIAGSRILLAENALAKKIGLAKMPTCPSASAKRRQLITLEDMGVLQKEFMRADWHCIKPSLAPLKYT
jgi:hypothetical protein